MATKQTAPAEAEAVESMGGSGDEGSGLSGERTPFAPIPEAVLDSKELSDFEVRLYGLLLRYRNGGTGECRPSYETLAARLGCSEKKIERGIGGLVRAGEVVVRRRSNGKHGRLPNQYDLARFQPRKPAALVQPDKSVGLDLQPDKSVPCNPTNLSGERKPLNERNPNPPLGAVSGLETPREVLIFSFDCLTCHERFETANEAEGFCPRCKASIEKEG